MERLFRTVFVSFLAMLALSPLATGAQEATPATDFVTPDPADCLVQPRTVEGLLAFFATPAATAQAADSDATPGAFVPPVGEPADAEVVAGITATTYEWFACLNANAFLRVFALYTDAYVGRSLISENVAPDALSLFATPIPPQEADERTSVAVRDVQVLPDGRVGAMVVSRSPFGDGSEAPTYVIFIEQDGRYLVDDIIFPPTPSDAATPAAG